MVTCMDLNFGQLVGNEEKLSTFLFSRSWGSKLKIIEVTRSKSVRGDNSKMDKDTRPII